MTENTPMTMTMTSSAARRSLDVWLTMWNTDGDIARRICADDCRIQFGATERDGSSPADAIRTADDFARYLDWWHEQHPGVVFTGVADAIDGQHGRLLSDLEVHGRIAGGADLFDFTEDGRIRRVWSVSGQRSLRS